MKYFKFLFLTLAMSLILFAGMIYGIICRPRGVFDSSYQSMIQDKFRILCDTDEKKIIVVAGSNMAFGLDQTMLEEKTGYKVANLGLHAGFGHLFYSELAKANINEGDIVLLGYEYDWRGENGFKDEDMDVLLTMSGIDDNITMYSYLPAHMRKYMLGSLFAYAAKKNDYSRGTGSSGIYSREAFDLKNGQMMMSRSYDRKYAEDMDAVDLTDVSVSDSSVEYLKSFKAYAEGKGASVYFVAPPVAQSSVQCDYSEFTKLKELEETLIGIDYISDPVQYIYPNEWMYDSRYHCNDIGEKMRTQMLVDDLINAGVISAQ